MRILEHDFHKIIKKDLQQKRRVRSDVIENMKPVETNENVCENIEIRENSESSNSNEKDNNPKKIEKEDEKKDDSIKKGDLFDLRDVVDIEIIFDDDDIVGHHRNSEITVKTITSDGNVDVAGCYTIFTEDVTKPLLTGLSLAEKLKKKIDPFAKRGGMENPGNLLFASYLWDIVLKTQFLGENKCCDFIEKLCKSFIPEMKSYNEEMDFSLFGEYVKWINRSEPGSTEKNNLVNSTVNWFDVPAILRMLGPTYESLVEAEYNPLKFYCSTTMKGLPHGVIMMPWYTFQLKKLIPGVKDSNEVSNLLSLTIFLIIKFDLTKRLL